MVALPGSKGVVSHRLSCSSYVKGPEGPAYGVGVACEPMVGLFVVGGGVRESMRGGEGVLSEESVLNEGLRDGRRTKALHGDDSLEYLFDSKA